jgi:hypothetical protein
MDVWTDVSLRRSKPFMFIWHPEAFSGANEKQPPLCLIRVSMMEAIPPDQITDIY